MIKRYISIVLLLASAYANAQTSTNPLFYARGYNVFTKTGLTLTSGDLQGPVATGGDLTLNGATAVAQQTSGSYPNSLNDPNNYGIIIGGKIIYTSGNVSYLKFGNLRIGNTTGTNLYATDNNNNALRLRATHGAFDASPRIELLENYQTTASATTASGIDFTAAFNQLEYNSRIIDSFRNQGTCGNFNYITIPSGSNPQITLQNNKINYINLTLAQLTNLTSQGSITFLNQPTSTRILIFNITGTGSYNWTNANLNLDENNAGPYVLYNFANVTALNFTGGPSITGTVFAPKADISKTGSNNNNGQIVGKTVVLAYGEVHYFPFQGLIPICDNLPTVQINTYPTSGLNPLALRGIKLTAATASNGAVLSWQVSGIEENVVYAVERSNDGNNFKSIYSMPASGNELGAQNYQFTDAQATGGISYYRIVATGLDGRTVLSNTATLRNTETHTLATASPVPFRDVLTVQIDNTAGSGVVSISLSDMTGRIISQKDATAGAAISFDNLAGLSSGIYLVRIADAGGRQLMMQKVIKD